MTIRPTKAQQRQRVLREIAAAGAAGLSCKELAAIWDCGLNNISGRFTELKKAGKIEKIATRSGSGVFRAI